MSNMNQEHDWEVHETLKEKLGYALLHQEHTDLVLLIGQGQEKVKCHRILLVANSPVFRAMLSAMWAQTDIKELELPYDDPESFVEFLHFLYTEDFRDPGLSTSMLISLFGLSEKYGVRSLWSRCNAMLALGLNIDNLLPTYLAAKLYGAKKLESICLNLICRKAREIFASDEILSLREEDLRDLLKHDELNIPELLLFRLVIRWAEEECRISDLPSTGQNIRSVLKESIYFIRFPLFTLEEFKTEIEDKDILTVEEKYSVLLSIVSPHVSRSRSSRPDKETSEEKFNSKPRLGSASKPKPVYVFKRFNQLIPNVERKIYCSEFVILPFKVNHPLIIISVGLFASAHQRHNFEAVVQLEDSRHNVLASVRQLSSLVHTGTIFHIMLPTPVRIAPDQWYTFALFLKGPETQRGNFQTQNKIVWCGNEPVEFTFEEYTYFSKTQLAEVCFQLDESNQTKTSTLASGQGQVQSSQEMDN